MVPHLVTALNGPLLDLEKKILDATPAIERWFRLEWQEHTPPFYCSVDLRNSGFKLAPVDTNLFPGGFNNLATEMLPLAVQAAMAAIEKYCPDAKNLLLIPERHTRNTFYLQNVAYTYSMSNGGSLRTTIASNASSGCTLRWPSRYQSSGSPVSVTGAMPAATAPLSSAMSAGSNACTLWPRRPASIIIEYVVSL
jgi:hypothetical protein